LKYRAEIDGLRALAVVPVILFHAGFELFSGGFVGVDVFFVISGYLITTILIEDIENNRFSLVNFYERRARRILPALLLVLLVTYAVSYLIYLPGAHKIVGQYVVSSILSASNVLLYLQGNEYFGLESGINPLFHTWSLGVEEQFYVFFPPFLFAVWRFRRHRVLWTILALAAVSLVLSEWSWRNKPTANFYLPLTRAWELLAGSIAAFIVQKQGVQKNELLALIGLAAIIFSIFRYDETIPFPSAYALVPVLGVVLLVLYADKETVAAKFLSTKGFVGIGLISYSAYLWHLPSQIYFDYLFPDSNLAIYYSLVFIAGASYISFRFVERPFRTRLSSSLTFTVIISTSIVLIGLGVMGHLNGGYPDRTEMLSKLQHNNGWGLRCNGNTSVNDSCASNSSPNIAVLGNSYAMTWVNSIRSTGGVDVVQLTQDGCAVGFIDVVQDVNSMPCEQFYAEAVTSITDSASINTVIISSPFDKELSSDEFTDSFISLLEMLHSKRIIIISPTPRAPFSVGECLMRYSLIGNDLNCDFIADELHHQKVVKLARLLSDFENVEFYDITDKICPSGRCVMNPNEGLFMYIDTGHLSIDGAAHVFGQMNLKFY
jgi:peptidoglycan/LPS O-acetylase OafA/YrhL